MKLKVGRTDLSDEKNCSCSDIDLIQPCHLSINQLLFDKKMNSISSNIYIEINDGLILSNSLIPNQNLRIVNLILPTIDDLYILLDGLVPNVETMIIQLCQQRILSCDRPKMTSSCLRLTQFELFEPRIGFVIDDIKCILGYMRNLIKLILSIRDTPDPIFCYGPGFESMLIEYIVTHRIILLFKILKIILKKETRRKFFIYLF